MNKAGIPTTDFTSHNDATPKVKVGTVVTDKATGKQFKYVKVVDANVTVGQSLEFAAADGCTVTNDRAGGSSLGRMVAGVAVGAITKNQYGFIQVAGLNAYVKTGGSVAAGHVLVPHASTDGIAVTGTTSTAAMQNFGYALAADTTSACGSVVLRCAY